MTVIRSDPSSSILSYLMAIDCWGHAESGGYSLFLQSLKPLIVPLFPTTSQDLRLKPMVRISSVSSISSSEREGREGREELRKQPEELRRQPEELRKQPEGEAVVRGDDPQSCVVS